MESENSGEIDLTNEYSEGNLRRDYNKKWGWLPVIDMMAKEYNYTHQEIRDMALPLFLNLLSMKKEAEYIKQNEQDANNLKR